jgi:hypothetical protein
LARSPFPVRPVNPPERAVRLRDRAARKTSAGFTACHKPVSQTPLPLTPRPFGVKLAIASDKRKAACMTLSRRNVIGLALGATLLPAVARAADPAPVRSNVSSFRMQDWRDHFDDLGRATIVADTVSRALHFWNADGSDYRVFPTSVPLSDELT